MHSKEESNSGKETTVSHLFLRGFCKYVYKFLVIKLIQFVEYLVWNSNIKYDVIVVAFAFQPRN